MSIPHDDCHNVDDDDVNDEMANPATNIKVYLTMAYDPAPRRLLITVFRLFVGVCVAKEGVRVMDDDDDDGVCVCV